MNAKNEQFNPARLGLSVHKEENQTIYSTFLLPKQISWVQKAPVGYLFINFFFIIGKVMGKASPSKSIPMVYTLLELVIRY